MKTNKNRFAYVGVMLLKGLAVGSFFTIYTPFLEEHGLSFVLMGFVNFIYHISAVMDVVTGLWADKYGRRKIFLSGTAMWGVSFVVYAFSTNLVGFVIAEFLGAVGAALESDALDSWLWNVETQEKAQKLKSDGSNVYKGAVLAMGLFGGWFTATHGLYWGWIFAAVMSFLGLAFGLVFLLSAEASPREEKTAGIVQQVKIKAVLKAVISNPKTRFVIACLVISSIASKPLFMYWPQRSAELGLSDELRGMMLFAVTLPGILGAYLAGKNIVFKSDRKGFLAVLISFVIGLLVASITKNFWVYVIGFSIAEMAYGADAVVIYSFFNKSFEDDSVRSTANSVKTVSKMLGGAIGLIGLGYIADVSSISIAWITSAMVMTALAVFVFAKRNG